MSFGSRSLKGKTACCACLRRRHFS
jgi:hypothetical protein